nr:AAA family ATPase [Bacillus horti]
MQHIDQTREVRATYSKEDAELIGQSGYTAPHNDILYDTVVASSLNKNILLQGPTGSGKTKLAEWISHLYQKPMHMINCSVDLDAEAMLGYKTIEYKGDQAHVEFIPGPVVQAMRKGHLLYIDEINMARPETLPILNGILDYRRSLTNPFTTEVIKAKEGFQVIASINIGYIGTVPLNEALKNRFIMIDVPYLQGDHLRSLVTAQSGQKDAKLINILVQLSEDLIFQVKAGQLSEEAASIRALLDAADLSVYLPLGRAIQRAIIDKLEDEREKAIIQNLVETLIK